MVTSPLHGKMSLIEPGLYLGDLASANNCELLLTNQITHIVSCGVRPDALSGGIKRIFVDVEDQEHATLAPFFKDVVDFIAEALASKGSVLVHW